MGDPIDPLLEAHKDARSFNGTGDGVESRARVAIEGQKTPMRVSTISPLDGASPPPTTKVSLLRSSINLPGSRVGLPIGDENDGFLPMAKDFITKTVLEVSPIRSIFPSPFSQKSLRCEEAVRGSLVRMRVNQAISGPSNPAVVVSCSTRKEVVGRTPDTPAITPISSPPREGVILRSD